MAEQTFKPFKIGDMGTDMVLYFAHPNDSFERTLIDTVPKVQNGDAQRLKVKANELNAAFDKWARWIARMERDAMEARQR